MRSVEEFEAAGLYDPDVHDGGRLALLEWLVGKGFSIEEMVEAAARDRLMSLAGDRRMLPGPRRSRTDAIAATGIDPETFDAIVTGLGFLPVEGDDEVRLNDAEIATVRTIGGLGDLFSWDEAMSLLRVYGAAIARLGEASNSLYVLDVETDLRAQGGSELDHATRSYDAIGVLDAVPELLEPVLRRHVYQAMERTRRTGTDEDLLFRFAVGFVDLVGYTEYSGSLPPNEFDEFIQRFEQDAYDITTACGARMVKLIGDAVMFVSPEVDAACRAARTLLDRFATTGRRVSPRGGLACGDVLVRGGDYYGPVVNLASRLAESAVPGEVLVDAGIVDASPATDFEPGGRRAIKGFAEPVRVWSLA